MKRVLLVALLIFAAGCAPNRGSGEEGARIQDTALTAGDTTNPSDTLPRIRDSMPDSTQH
jgi:hypothetical protein